MVLKTSLDAANRLVLIENGCSIMSIPFLFRLSSFLAVVSFVLLLRAIGRFMFDLLVFYGCASMESGDLRASVRGLMDLFRIENGSWKLRLLQKAIGLSGSEFDVFTAMVYGSHVGNPVDSRSPPLSPTAVQRLPRSLIRRSGMSLVADNVNGDTVITMTPEDVCPICIDGFEEEQEIKTLSCAHVFHSDCIDGWLRRHSICPICKTDLTSTQQEALPSAPSVAYMTALDFESDLSIPLMSEERP